MTLPIDSREQAPQFGLGPRLICQSFHCIIQSDIMRLPVGLKHEYKILFDNLIQNLLV